MGGQAVSGNADQNSRTVPSPFLQYQANSTGYANCANLIAVGVGGEEFIFTHEGICNKACAAAPSQNLRYALCWVVMEN